MRILAIEPLAPRGHIRLNACLVGCLAGIGPTTLATFEEYHCHFRGVSRIRIPRRFKHAQPPLRCRLNQLQILRHVLTGVRVENYDVVVFLSYETVSMAICWPRWLPVFLIEHNNIDNVLESPLKRWFYRRLPGTAHHLVFMDGMAGYVIEQTGRPASHIPYPCYGDRCLPDRRSQAERPCGADAGKKIIFCPSRSTPRHLLNRLKAFVLENEGFFLVAKGEQTERGERFDIRPFFDDYDQIMLSTDYVFFGGQYRYRVSAVVFEALSLAKPVLVLDCPFGQELGQAYPRLVIPIRDVGDIRNVAPEPEGMEADHRRFLAAHAPEAITLRLAEILQGSRFPRCGLAAG